MNTIINFGQILILCLFLIACENKQPTEEDVISTYPDGTPMKSNIIRYEGNKKIIMQEVRYFPNGEKELEGDLIDGVKHGIWIYWFDNGTKWLEENYVNGKLSGSYTEWYRNGESNFTGEYKNGSPDGEWEFWDAEGNKKETIEYKDGKPLK